MGQTSRNAIMGRYQSRGEDFLHLVEPGGTVIGGVDNTGSGFGTMQGGFVPPPTKVLYVDANRTDSYTSDGSSLKPFKTITEAIIQIIQNGDNVSNAYSIDIATGVYPETVVLESSGLYDITFWGHNSAVLNQGVQSQVNNTNLNLHFF